MSDMPAKLRIVTILDPLQCVRCDNAYIADVVLTDGQAKRMLYCGRLDCDNWIVQKESEIEVSQADPPK